MKKINLALAGGGLKSFAQIAVLHELEKNNIQIEAVSGTSMGSLIAAFVALELDAQTIEEEMLNLEKMFQNKSILYKPSPKILPFTNEKISGGYIDGALLEPILDTIFKKYGVYNIEDVKKPLAIPSVDITSGKLIVFVSDIKSYKTIDNDHIVETNVPLSKAIRASSSIPLMFSHVKYKEYNLVDGGIRLNVPVPLLKGYSNRKTLAITTKRKSETEDASGIINIATQVYNLMSTEFDIYLARSAHYNINIPMGRVQLSLGKGREIIQYAHDHIIEHKLIEQITK